MKTIPEVIPAGWHVMGESPYLMIGHVAFNGLQATFSLETYGDADSPLGEFYMGPGRYRRMVISRKKMYPTWDEMRDFIYTCGLFDGTRATFMVLPPKSEYVSVHPNAFHFFQKEL